MYILCNEEPLWMILCLKGSSGLIQYQGSWKKTALHKYVSPYLQFLLLKYIYYPFSVLHFSFYLMLTYSELGILNVVRICRTNTKSANDGHYILMVTVLILHGSYLFSVQFWAFEDFSLNQGYSPSCRFQLFIFVQEIIPMSDHVGSILCR